MKEELGIVDVDPAAVTAIAEALQALAKALRANQLYLPNNPTRQRATEVAESLFAAVWKHTSSVRLEIRETEFLWEEEAVYRDAERGTEALPFLLHRDGLREIEFLPEFENEDLDSLLALIQRAKSAQPDEDDLVTLLWVADLNTVRYRHVEIGGETDLPMMLVGGNGIATFTSGVPQLAVPSAESPVPGDGPPPEIVRVEDFYSTLYFLETNELAYLKNEVRREYDTDGRLAVLSILLDTLETQSNVTTQAEIVGILDVWFVDLIANADYNLVAYLLRESAATISRTPTLSPPVCESLQSLAVRLSEPSVIAQLLQALDESVRAPTAETLEGLFGQMRATAMATLLGWLTSATSSPVRVAVEHAATALAAANTAELARLLEHDDELVVRGAVRMASRLKSPATVAGLSKVLNATNAAIRVEAVVALGEIASTSALQSLERAVDDGDRDVRVAVLKAIATNRFAAALPRLAQALRRKDLTNSDLGEKMALFEAYGRLCGESGVAVLDGLLNGRSLLRFRASSEVRACAARALGIVGSPTALTALQRAANTKDVVVRNAIVRAGRGSA